MVTTEGVVKKLFCSAAIALALATGAAHAGEPQDTVVFDNNWWSYAKSQDAVIYPPGTIFMIDDTGTPGFKYELVIAPDLKVRAELGCGGRIIGPFTFYGDDGSAVFTVPAGQVFPEKPNCN